MALDYPTTLPCPQTLTATPFERWQPSSPAEAAILQAFWKDDLRDGGAWFNATWPLPQGRVPAVFRFIEQPRWRMVPGGRWRVEAVLEQRGRGLSVSQPAPVGNPPTPWNTANPVGAWTFTNADFTASSSEAGAYVVSETGVSVGDYYAELVVSFDFDEGGAAEIVAGVSLVNPGAPSDGAGWGISGNILVESVVVDALSALATGDVVMVAVETLSGKVWLGRNGVWIGDPSARTGEVATFGVGNEYWLAFGLQGTEAAYSCSLRTAESQFDYPLPTDFAEWAF